MASRKPKAEPIDVLPEGLAAEVEARVRAERAVPRKKLSKVTLTRRAEAELEEHLLRRGLERTAKVIRLPLEVQIGALLERSELVPLTKIKPALAGATSQAEVAQAALALVRQEKAQFVVSGGKEAIGRVTLDALGQQETEALRRGLKALGDLLKKAKPRAQRPAPALLRSEVAALLQAFAPKPGAEEILLGAVEKLEGADSLVYVPDLARRLSREMDTAELHRVLREASLAGRLELRPEGGIRTLSAEDAALCVPGSQGTLLSYVRRR